MKRKDLRRAELAREILIVEIAKLDRQLRIEPETRYLIRSTEYALNQLEAVDRMIKRGREEAVRVAAVKVAKDAKLGVKASDFIACESCGWSHPMPEAMRVMHCHHVILVSRGGGNDPSNLVILCPNCHAVAHTIMARGTYPETRDSLFRLLESGPLTEKLESQFDATL